MYTIVNTQPQNTSQTAFSSDEYFMGFGVLVSVLLVRFSTSLVCHFREVEHLQKNRQERS